MHSLPRHLRWIARVCYLLVSGLLLYIGATRDIPEFIATEVPLLQSLGGETLVRILAFVLFFVVAVLAIGPTTLRAWGSSLSDWWHASARQIEGLEEDKKELQEEIKTLRARIETLKDQAASRQPSDAEELKQSSRDLAVELNRFIQQYREERPDTKLKAALLRAQTEEERQEIQGQMYREVRAFFQWKQAQYEWDFRGRAIAIIDAAVRRGWVGVEWRDRALTAGTNELTLVDLAGKLDEIGHRK